MDIQTYRDGRDDAVKEIIEGFEFALEEKGDFQISLSDCISLLKDVHKSEIQSRTIMV